MNYELSKCIEPKRSPRVKNHKGILPKVPKVVSVLNDLSDLNDLKDLTTPPDPITFNY